MYEGWVDGDESCRRGMLWNTVQGEASDLVDIAFCLPVGDAGSTEIARIDDANCGSVIQGDDFEIIRSEEGSRRLVSICVLEVRNRLGALRINVVKEGPWTNVDFECEVGELGDEGYLFFDKKSLMGQPDIMEEMIGALQRIGDVLTWESGVSGGRFTSLERRITRRWLQVMEQVCAVYWWVDKIRNKVEAV